MASLRDIAVRSKEIAQPGRLHTPNVSVREDHRLKEAGLCRYLRLWFTGAVRSA